MSQAVPEFEEQSAPVFISRQPIFDRDKSLYAYNVVLHHAEGKDASLSLATEGMSDALHGVGEKARLFISCPASITVPDELFHIEKDRLGLVMDMSPDSQKQSRMGYAKLKKQGFYLVLDGYTGQPHYDALVALADVIILPFNKLPIPTVLGLARQLKKSNAHLMASGIRDWESFEGAKVFKFKYFHGPFFGTPHVVPGRSISTSSLSRIRLLKALQAPSPTLESLANVVVMDPTLSYKLLKFMNTASMGFKSRITSIPHAITLLGIVPFTRWALAVVMSEFDNTTRGRELVYLALQRSRFLELTGSVLENVSYAADTLVLLGLFSKLDALVGMPMDQLLDDMPLNPIIRDALNGRQNSAREWLDLLEAIETGDWGIVFKIVNKYDISSVDAAKNYFFAASWAKNIIGVLESQ